MNTTLTDFSLLLVKVFVYFNSKARTRSNPGNIGMQNNQQENSETNVDDLSDDDSPDDELHISFKSVHPLLSCSVKEAMQMIYTFSVRHSLSWTATEDVAQLVNSILGNSAIPSSKYLFRKMFCKKNSPAIHFQCTYCRNYLGQKSTFGTAKEVKCDNCGQMSNVETKYRKNHFISIPVVPQIRSTLQQNIQKNYFISNPMPSIDLTITDIFDGTLYRDLKAQMGGTRFITITVSTDGAVVQKSTKDKSFWPLQIFINEIQNQHRFKRENIICGAFAYGRTPDMAIFLKPFIEEINYINSQGGLAITIDNCVVKYRIIPMFFTTDSVAKAYVACKTSHNSYNGCPYCEHPGKIISRQVRYCYENNAPERTHEATKNNMIEASAAGNPVNGYRGITPMLALDTHFDTVWGFVIDKMHSVDLGVIKKMFNLYLDSKNKNER